MFKLPCLSWFVTATPENTEIHVASVPRFTYVFVTTLAQRDLELWAV